MSMCACVYLCVCVCVCVCTHVPAETVVQTIALYSLTIFLDSVLLCVCVRVCVRAQARTRSQHSTHLL